MESTLSFARESGELCELPVLMRGAAWHAAPLASAPSRVALVTADFGGVALQVLRSEPGMLIIESAPDTAAIIRLFEGRARGRWDGRAIGAHDVALCGGELRHQAVLPDGWACIVLSLSGAAAETAAAPDTRPGSGAAAAVVPADPGVLSELAEIAHAIEQAATDRASPLFDPEARRSLRAALLDAARRIFASPVPGLAAGRRDGTASQRIVHAANDYLRANPVRPIYTDELCAAIGVSATRTHQAFVETFCLSPHRFLKLRRMGMVRAAVLSRAEPRRSIKHVALSHGF